MPVIVADDGYKLWYEVAGEGPALVFPARLRVEFAALGAALAERYRVVRFKPRHVVGVLEAEEEAGGPWEPESFTRYPVEMAVDDLHTVADAAGVNEIVLAGYSGMAALAGFLAPVSDRTVGLMVGGFPLLASGDYWLGFEEGARSALVQAGLPDKAVDHHLGRLFYREWGQRDDRELLAALPGPKVLWFGSRDCEPDCRMYDFVGGAAIARHLHARAEELREIGFELIELDGHDHIGALAATELIASRLTAALAGSTW
jgi:pimeloyl-ACP methyl ester carboxylesterase